MNPIKRTTNFVTISSLDEGLGYLCINDLTFVSKGINETVLCEYNTFTSTLLDVNSNRLPNCQPRPTFYLQSDLPTNFSIGSKLCSTEFETYVHMLDHTGVVFDFNNCFSYGSQSFSMTESHEFIHPKYKQAAYSYAVLSLYDAVSYEMCSLVETPFSEMMLNTENVVESMNAPYSFVVSKSYQTISFSSRTLTSSLSSSFFHHVSTCTKKSQPSLSTICHSDIDMEVIADNRAYLNQLNQVNTTSDRFRVCINTALRLSLVAFTLYTLLLENNKANILITQRP